MMEIKRMSPGSLVLNEGQIEGLPANPRQWTEDDVESLARSLIETPELFEARPIIAVKHGSKYVVLGGNMRTLAAENAGMSKVPVAVLPEDTSIEKMKEIVIKDNGSFGMWDTKELNDKWGDLPLGEWGVLLPEWAGEENTEEEGENTEQKDLSDTIDNIYQIAIDCDSEEEQERIYNELKDRYNCRILSI